MNLWSLLKQRFSENVTIKRLLIVIMLLVIVTLLMITDRIWLGFLHAAFAILMPFILALGIAYVVYPLISYAERWHLPRLVVIPALLALIVLLVWWVLSALLPSIYQESVQIFNSMIDSLGKIYTWYVEASDNDPSPLVKEVYNALLSEINQLTAWLPSIPIFIQKFLTNILAFVTNFMLVLILFMYMIFDYERIIRSIRSFSERISTTFAKTMYNVERSIGQYLRALFLVMLIKLAEYFLIYTVVGHPYAFVMALLTALGSMVPYLGGIAANAIGLLTALSLPTPNLIFLLLLVLVASNIDAYVIAPMVYSKRIKTNPLISLLWIFAFGKLFGPFGIFFAIPAYLSVRSLIQTRMPLEEPIHAKKEADE